MVKFNNAIFLTKVDSSYDSPLPCRQESLQRDVLDLGLDFILILNLLKVGFDNNIQS